jgi:DNA-binding transcriptional regulator YiaG
LPDFADCDRNIAHTHSLEKVCARALTCKVFRQTIIERPMARPPENASVPQVMAFDTKRTTREAGSDLGRAIRSIRLRENRGQAEFARLQGWPQATLSQYESGDAHPHAERLIGLLRLAATEDERGPILKALEERGILGSDLDRTRFAPAPDMLVSGGTR